MSFEITLVQTCDACAETRVFDLRNFMPLRESTIDTILSNGGWREIKTGKHICNECINKALSGELNK